jgi:hypothetical protein
LLHWASDDLKNNKEIVLEAVKQDSNSISFADKNLQNDNEIMIESTKIKPNHDYSLFEKKMIMSV